MPTIRELREKAELTQMELAVKAHLSLPVISRAENGHRISKNSLRCICQVLGVKRDEITFIRSEAR